jgi:hypothetical protein
LNIGIVDAEIMGNKKHRFPNLVCMKLSGYHKRKGDSVTLLLNYDNIEQYDKVYISKVFTDTSVDLKILELPNVEYGGTGFFYDKATPLKHEIEHCMPDYDLYANWVKQFKNPKKNEFKYYLDYSIGYLTRGCFRKCAFCVNKNSNGVVAHSPIEEFLDNKKKKICLLDDNFLGYSKWKESLLKLQDTNRKFQFKQGLDERLLTEEKTKILFNSKYDEDFIFAFDNIEDKPIIINKLNLIKSIYNRKSQNIKFYVLCGYDKNNKYDDAFWIQDIQSVFERIFILMQYNCKPYIMRYNKCSQSKHKGTYVNLACWANQPHVYTKMSYREFCEADDKRKGGLFKSSTYRYMRDFEKDSPIIAKTYYDVKFTEVNRFR